MASQMTGVRIHLTADERLAKQLDRLAGILGIDRPEAIARAIAAYLFLVEAHTKGHEIAVVKNQRQTIAYVDLGLPKT